MSNLASENGSSGDALLPRILSSVPDAASAKDAVSNAALASGSPSGSGSYAVGLLTSVIDSFDRCQRLGQGAPGTFASPPGLAQALRVAPTMVGGGLSRDTAGGTGSEPRAGGLGEGAFILEAEGPRPLAAVVGRPPEGMKRCAPDSQEWASSSTLPTSQLGPRVEGGGLTPGAPATPDIGLFSGRQTPESAPHALTGLVGGVIPRALAPRGSCVIRGSAPHLWALAAEAMGLRRGGAGGAHRLVGLRGRMRMWQRP